MHNYYQLKAVKWLIPILFLGIIGVNCYLTIAKNKPLDKFACLMLFLLVLAWLGKRHVLWIIGIVICSYGLYSLLFISPKAAVPTSMEFTAPLNYLIFGNKTGTFSRHIIRLVPLFFYPLFLMFLLFRLGNRSKNPLEK